MRGLHRQPGVRRHRQPVEPGADAGRLERRRGGGGGRRHRARWRSAQDGGGSIRRPASHTGLVGLKPSLSAWPRQHVLPGLLLDFDVHRPDGAHGGRCAPAVRRDARARSRRRPLVASAAWAAGAAAPQRPARRRLRVLYVERFDATPLDRADRGQLPRRPCSSSRPSATGSKTAPCRSTWTSSLEAWPQIGQIGLARCSSSIPTGKRRPAPKYRDDGRQQAAASRRARLWQILERVTQLRRDSAALFERVDVHRACRPPPRLPWPAQEAYPTHHRRPGSRPARPRRLHRLGQRRRPAGAGAAVRAFARRPADRPAVDRPLRRRRPAAGPRRRLRSAGALGGSLAAPLTASRHRPP